jgi:hypothetical protein
VDFHQEDRLLVSWDLKYNREIFPQFAGQDFEGEEILSSAQLEM